MLKKLSLVSLVVFSFSANAAVQTTNWDWNANTVGSTQNYSTSTGYNSLTYNDGAISATITAWSDNSSSGSVANPNQAGNSDPYLQQGQLYLWGSSGWGIVNQDEGSGDNPGHSIDNMGNSNSADYDMVLLSFNTAVSLTGIDIGWDYGSSADFSVLALDDQSSPDLNTQSTWQNVNANLKEWAGNYTVSTSVNNGYYSFANDTKNVTSKYWLVGAYNSIFGGSLSANNDGFKLQGFTASTFKTTSVPEPATLLLMVLALVGIARQQRTS